MVSCISWILWIPGVGSLLTVKGRAVALKEIFTRFQLVAVSLLFMNFRDLYYILEIWSFPTVEGPVVGPKKKALLDPSCLPFHRFSLIFIDFEGFHDISFLWISGVGSLPMVKGRTAGPKKPLIDTSWLQFHIFWMISQIFIGSHWCLWISGVGSLPTVKGRAVVDLKGTFTRFQLLAIIDSSIHRC